MKKIWLIIGLLLPTMFALTCPVCERNQPKILRGYVHGIGPDSNWDYIVIWATVVIVAISFYYSVKYLIKPGEGDKQHIKYSILKP